MTPFNELHFFHEYFVRNPITSPISMWSTKHQYLNQIGNFIGIFICWHSHIIIDVVTTIFTILRWTFRLCCSDFQVCTTLRITCTKAKIHWPHPISGESCQHIYWNDLNCFDWIDSIKSIFSIWIRIWQWKCHKRQSVNNLLTVYELKLVLYATTIYFTELQITYSDYNLVIKFSTKTVICCSFLKLFCRS